MALVDDLLRKHGEGSLPKRCKLGELIEALDPATSEALVLYVEKAREDKSLQVHKRAFTAAWLEQSLSSWGHEIGRTVISEHINERCSCDISQ